MSELACVPKQLLKQLIKKAFAFCPPFGYAYPIHYSMPFHNQGGRYSSLMLRALNLAHPLPPTGEPV